MTFRVAILIFGVFSFIRPVSAVAGPFYSAADDFSATDNPNGVWTYGNMSGLGGSLDLYTNHLFTAWMIAEGFQAWTHDEAHLGNVVFNPSSTAHPFWLPGMLTFHPALNGDLSVVRWTAPLSGIVQIDSEFTGRDSDYPTSTDVHVAHNGVSVFDAFINEFGSGPSFDTSLAVLTGDTIDFAVGYGANGNYTGDTTSIDATIMYTSGVPEPSSLALLCLGLLGFGRRAVRVLQG